MADKLSEELREKLGKMIALHGEAFNSDVRTFGDSRGQNIYSAEEHLKTCSVKTLKDYEEDFSWNIYDSASEESYIGVKGSLTCKCGQVENITFIVPNAGLATILGWILEDK
jgi:hypothetical protein